MIFLKWELCTCDQLLYDLQPVLNIILYIHMYITFFLIFNKKLGMHTGDSEKSL